MMNPLLHRDPDMAAKPFAGPGRSLLTDHPSGVLVVRIPVRTHDPHPQTAVEAAPLYRVYATGKA